MTSTGHLLTDLARWLREARTEYAIVGGIAVVRYGYVRETKDIVAGATSSTSGSSWTAAKATPARG